jgi:galactonate dehydratase
MCDAYETNVASHAFAGPLATIMSAHFCAVVPNLRTMELDVDEVPWRAKLMTNACELVDGHLVLPKGPGWGAEPDEAMLLKHKAA